jgi:hypothetical protein
LGSFAYPSSYDLKGASPLVFKGGFLQSNATVRFLFAFDFSRIPTAFQTVGEDSLYCVAPEPPRSVCAFAKDGRTKNSTTRCLFSEMTPALQLARHTFSWSAFEFAFCFCVVATRESPLLASRSGGIAITFAAKWIYRCATPCGFRSVAIAKRSCLRVPGNERRWGRLHL